MVKETAAFLPFGQRVLDAILVDDMDGASGELRRADK
jgi:hypothetical protein